MKRDVLSLLACAVGCALLMVGIHEGIHVLIDIHVSGSVPNCANGLPVHVVDGQIRTCVGSNHDELAIVAPFITSVVGAIITAVGTYRRSIPVFCGGGLVWLGDATYALGVMPMPTDYMIAKDTLGSMVYVPGLLALAIGVVGIALAVMVSVTEDRKT